jgi:hypothetical protein
MKILIRRNGMKDWKLANPIKAKAEVDLQDLILESPSLIPVDEIREDISPLVVAVDEIGLPGSGATDVLAFNSDGDIVIIECKLAANPESKRKVVGQILEYGAYLWEMDYKEVNSRIKKKTGKDLSELVRVAIGKEAGETGKKDEIPEEETTAQEWEEEDFRKSVEENLNNGSFILVIVVDEINEDLRKIIRFINECSKSAFSFHALEINRFQSANIEVLVPYLHGISTKLPPEPKRKTWTEEEFFKVLMEKAPDAVDTVKKIYEWANTVKGGGVSFGMGKGIGTFKFNLMKDDKEFTIFIVYTGGRIALHYRSISDKAGKEIAEEFHKRLQEIPTFKKIPSDLSKYPEIKISDVFKSPENVETFKQAVFRLRDRIGSMA